MAPSFEFPVNETLEEIEQEEDDHEQAQPEKHCCDRCGKIYKFINKINLKDHLRTVHSDTLF